MSKSDNDTKITLKGERAAMGGYLPQYDIFAIGIYEAMEAGTLEEIRVADMVDHVGKQDDVVYVTTDSVHAYQVKWSIIDAGFAYPDFKKLIKEVVDGWRSLKKLYADKTIYPYLLTNKSLTEGDYSIKALAGKDAGGFKEYEEDVLLKLKKGNQLMPNGITLYPNCVAFQHLQQRSGVISGVFSVSSMIIKKRL